MADLIQIYTNNPTVMGMDGTLVSNGTGLAPISASLDAAKEEQKAIKCALRIPTGYKQQGNIKLKFIGENASMWKLAIDGYSETDAANRVPDSPAVRKSAPDRTRGCSRLESDRAAP